MANTERETDRIERLIELTIRSHVTCSLDPGRVGRTPWPDERRGRSSHGLSESERIEEIRRILTMGEQE